MEIIRQQSSLSIDNNTFHKIKKAFDDLRKEHPKWHAFSVIRKAVLKVCGEQHGSVQFCRYIASRLARYRNERKARRKETEEMLRQASVPSWEKEEKPEDPGWPQLEY